MEVSKEGKEDGRKDDESVLILEEDESHAVSSRKVVSRMLTIIPL